MYFSENLGNRASINQVSSSSRTSYFASARARNFGIGYHSLSFNICALPELPLRIVLHTQKTQMQDRLIERILDSESKSAQAVLGSCSR